MHTQHKKIKLILWKCLIKNNCEMFRHEEGFVMLHRPTISCTGISYYPKSSPGEFLRLNYLSIRICHKWLKQNVWTQKRGWCSKKAIESFNPKKNTRSTCRTLFYSVRHWVPIITNEILEKRLPKDLADIVSSYLPPDANCETCNMSHHVQVI